MSKKKFTLPVLKEDPRHAVTLQEAFDDLRRRAPDLADELADEIEARLKKTRKPQGPTPKQK